MSAVKPRKTLRRSSIIRVCLDVMIYTRVFLSVLAKFLVALKRSPINCQVKKPLFLMVTAVCSGKIFGHNSSNFLRTKVCA